MQPLTPKKKQCKLNKLKDNGVLLGDMCFVIQKSCIEHSKMLGTCRASHNPHIHSSHFDYPYGLAFNQVYLGGTHLDKHDRLTCVFKCICKLDLIFKFSNLKKKLGNKYEHVHEPMVFLVVNFCYFVKFLFRKMLSVNVFYQCNVFLLQNEKKYQKNIGKHIKNKIKFETNFKVKTFVIKTLNVVVSFGRTKTFNLIIKKRNIKWL